MAPTVLRSSRSVPNDPNGTGGFIPASLTVAARVVWAARHEQARTVEDVLARRTRALFLDAPRQRRGRARRRRTARRRPRKGRLLASGADRAVS